MRVKNLSRCFGMVPTEHLIKIINNKRKENFLVYNRDGYFALLYSEGSAIQLATSRKGVAVNLRG